MNKPVKKIALVANANKPAAGRIVQRAAKLAAAAGMRPVTDESAARSADLVMVFGGDGTMLQWARNTAGSGMPIFGVNIGGMGFLTAVSGKDLAKAIRSIAAREFSVESRTLLSATGEADGGRFRLDAMNDFVISRGSVPRMIRLEVKVNGEVLTVYRCDGLVVSSATGSTAYSLAAGGAIVAPDAGVFSITPICPHTLSNRAVIVGQQSTVEVRVLDQQREATLCADGRDVVELAADNPVTIRRSRRTVKLAAGPLPFCNRITTPWKTWIRSRSPSLIRKFTLTVSPALNLGILGLAGFFSNWAASISDSLTCNFNAGQAPVV